MHFPWSSFIIGFCALLLGSSGAAARGAERVIPADAETASARLNASPRHGEWVDVPLAGGAAIRSFVVYPEVADKAPVVIVIHEIFGLTDWVRAVADQLAAEGFIAIAPDLLSGMGPGGGGTESLGEKVRETIRTLTPDDQARRLDAVRDFAMKIPSGSGKLGVVGFCWGGSASFSYATRQPGVSGAVVYYGTAPTAKDQLEKIACPVLGLYGGNDNRVNATLDATRAAMTEAGKKYDTKVYEGAGHGFLRQQSGQDGKNLAASRQAWEETVGFFREALK